MSPESCRSPASSNAHLRPWIGLPAAARENSQATSTLRLSNHKVRLTSASRHRSQLIYNFRIAVGR